MCRYGSLVRLLTEQPPKLSEADLIRLQRGACAACRNPLPPPVKQSGFLGSRNAHLVRSSLLQQSSIPEGLLISGKQHNRMALNIVGTEPSASVHSLLVGRTYCGSCRLRHTSQ